MAYGTPQAPGLEPMAILIRFSFGDHTLAVITCHGCDWNRKQAWEVANAETACTSSFVARHQWNAALFVQLVRTSSMFLPYA